MSDRCQIGVRYLETSAWCWDRAHLQEGEGEGEGEGAGELQPAWSDSRGPWRCNQRPSAPCGWATGRAWSWWTSVSVQSKLTRMHTPSPRRRRHSHTMGLGGSRERPRMSLEMISSESRVGLRLTASMQAEHSLGSAPRSCRPPSTATLVVDKRWSRWSNARWLAGSLGTPGALGTQRGSGGPCCQR